MTDKEIEKLADQQFCDYKELLCLGHTDEGYLPYDQGEYLSFVEGFKRAFKECTKSIDLELIHIINDIIKYHTDEETRKNEYEIAVLKLARYWEKLGKIELTEWTLAQIGVNAWTIQ